MWWILLALALIAFCTPLPKGAGGIHLPAYIMSIGWIHYMIESIKSRIFPP